MAADVGAKERKIIVAVDEGEESTYGLSWCVNNVVVQNSQDSLVLLYAKPPPAVYTAMDGTGRREPNPCISQSPYLSRLPYYDGYLFSSDIMASMEKYSAEVADSVIQKSKRLCKDLQGVKVETRVETGDPRDVICEAVDKLGADVLVMGSHGYGMIKRAFLGSVSNHCAQNVKCPVLIVKKPKSIAGSK
ncbi:hypothetical protein L1049_021079 [Liquidambar formosana]|uniref:UspA domain-containing protein n=1 Tax=Liquidambar formosana TaxID=63359 RepID=A0AAP0X4U6_LIQFO